MLYQPFGRVNRGLNGGSDGFDFLPISRPVSPDFPDKVRTSSATTAKPRPAPTGAGGFRHSPVKLAGQHLYGAAIFHLIHVLRQIGNGVLQFRFVGKT